MKHCGLPKVFFGLFFLLVFNGYFSMECADGCYQMNVKEQSCYKISCISIELPLNSSLSIVKQQNSRKLDSFKICASENILPHVVCECAGGGILRVGLDSSSLCIQRNTVVNCILNIKNLENISIKKAGIGHLWVTAGIEANKVLLNNEGSGMLEVQYLKCDELEAKINGSGTIKFVHGTATRQKFETTGGGCIEAGNLVGYTAEIIMTNCFTGIGTISVNIRGSLNLYINVKFGLILEPKDGLMKNCFPGGCVTKIYSKACN
jgi:hypothetical protein